MITMTMHNTRGTHISWESQVEDLKILRSGATREGNPDSPQEFGRSCSRHERPDVVAVAQ